MSSLFSRFHNRSRRLPLGVLFAASQLWAPVAHAQVSSAQSAAPAASASAPVPTEPLLTDGPHPTSSIASSRRVALKPLRSKDLRDMMMSIPDVTEKTVAQVAAPIPAPKTVSLPLPGVTTSPKTAQLTPPPATAPLAAPPRIVKTPSIVFPSKAFSTAPVAKTAVPSGELASPSSRFAAKLPARGGLVLGTTPETIDVAPRTAETEAPRVSESQRLMLAQLDSDLAKAQKRLDRAETRLSDGQRQLGAFTGVLQSAMLDAGDDARGLHPFVRVAQRYLGTPYVWGGESARGFDCSGFIMRVMRDLGYKALPHSAAEQFHYGIPIAKPLLKPGDVVFFANTYKPGISHVGIYLGKSRFIHAANSHVGTIVSSLNEPKWIEKYAGARRLVQSDT